MLKSEFEASETIVRVPLAVPELVGANVAVNVTLWFGLSVVGRVNPPIEKAAPDVLAPEIVTEELPELITVSNKLLELPMLTLPNVRLEGFVEIVPALFWGAPFNT